MPHEPEHIAALYEQRKTQRGPLLSRMREVRDVYNSDIVLPLPELSTYERAAVVNHTQRGIDKLGERVASVLPNITVPPLRPGIGTSEARAHDRRRILFGWRERNRMPRVMQRRSRWLLGYGSAPVLVRPDLDLEGPRWDPHSPLDVFPAPTHLDVMTPRDVILVHRRPLSWIEANYPAAALGLRTTRIPVERSDSRTPQPSDEFDVLEYIDPEVVQFVVVGQAKDHDPYGYTDYQVSPGQRAFALVDYPNRAGVCWGVVPGRVTLERPLGHFDSILGMYQTQAALMAMQVIATRRAIWPETWLIAHPNEAPVLMQLPEPAEGVPGVVRGGSFDRGSIDPSFQAQQVIDRLEQTQRESAGLPPELSGASQTNVRTGRRGSQIISASIDHTIAAAQDLLAESMHAENERAIAIDKAYFNFSKSMYVATKGARGKVDYTPSETWEKGAQHIVEYPLAGTDLSELVINGGQRIGQGTLSKKSFMDIDPLVNDVDSELRQLNFEAMQNAWMMSVQTLASQPEGPWQAPDIARIAKLMFAEEKNFYEAVDQLQREKQEEQAEGAPPGAPEAQPGLAEPGQGAEVPTVGETEPSVQNMTSLLSQLGVTQQAIRSR